MELNVHFTVHEIRFIMYYEHESTLSVKTLTNVLCQVELLPKNK